MRAAVISTFYPNRADPVRAVFVRNLVTALAQYAEITVVSPIPYAPPLRRVARWAALRTVPSRDCDGGREVLHPRYVVIPKCDPLSGLTYFAGVFGTLRSRARARRFDILHGHCAFPDAVGVALAATSLELPFAVTAHGTDINVYAERSLIRGQISWALRRAAVVIAVSKALQEKIRRLVPSISEKVVHIPCAGVDPRVFAIRDQTSARQSLGVAEDGRIVIFAGRLVGIKGVSVLLNAWRILSADARLGPNDRLMIIGDGPERRTLEAQASAHGLQRTVRFLGDVPQEHVARWLNAATVFCLPSHHEGTPNVIVEALASGRPVVASRVGGVPETVEDGRNGLLVEPGNDVLLSQALARALERRWESVEVAASAASLTWDTLARRNIAVLERALAERHGSAACAR